MESLWTLPHVQAFTLSTGRRLFLSIGLKRVNHLRNFDLFHFDAPTPARSAINFSANRSMLWRAIVRFRKYSPIDCLSSKVKIKSRKRHLASDSASPYWKSNIPLYSPIVSRKPSLAAKHGRPQAIASHTTLSPEPMGVMFTRTVQRRYQFGKAL